MERQLFYFLYVNLNSLAELALRQLAAKILAQPAAVPEELTEEERDARMMASFENMDLSALDGLDFSDDSAEFAAIGAELDSIEAPLLPIPTSLPESELDAQNDAESDGEIDIEIYMTRAYSYEEQLRERVDDCYRRADLSFLDKALSQLPDRLPPLTRQLSAADMTEWLVLYAEGSETLTQLITRIRQLDIATRKL